MEHMEQRWSLRTPISIDVDLDWPGVEQISARTRDVGLGGVFVETTEVMPPKNTTVELTFHLPSGGKRVKYRIKARVVRVVQGGVGMMFKDYNINTFRSLQEVMHFRNHSRQKDDPEIH